MFYLLVAFHIGKVREKLISGDTNIWGHQALSSVKCFQNVQESRFFSFGDLRLEGLEKKAPVL